MLASFFGLKGTGGSVRVCRFLFLIIFIYKIFRIYYIIVMEMNKLIKIVYKDSFGEINECEIKLRNILDLKRHTGFVVLHIWDRFDGRRIHIFDDKLVKWFDKEGVEHTDYAKLVDTLSVYAEQTKLKDALAYLN
jgi:hypothetical protein